jgi:hypothetical protein
MQNGAQRPPSQHQRSNHRKQQTLDDHRPPHPRVHGSISLPLRECSSGYGDLARLHLTSLWRNAGAKCTPRAKPQFPLCQRFANFAAPAPRVAEDTLWPRCRGRDHAAGPVNLARAKFKPPRLRVYLIRST